MRASSVCVRFHRRRPSTRFACPSRTCAAIPSLSTTPATPTDTPGLADQPDASFQFKQGSQLKSFNFTDRASSVIVSGMQPTGSPHIGNYLGAISQWIQLQDTPHNTFYSVVDLHAITLPQDPASLRGSTLHLAACFLACGVDEKKSSLFIQSHVPQHSELCWLLSCSTPHHQLATMTQYKDKKAGKPHLGLFAYPVLMTADILLYKATHVPVGEDQLQHLELARRTAHSFNLRYETEVFPIPMAISQQGAVGRVMSLRDATKKMSKSDLSDLSRIDLMDSPEAISDKINRAKTDSMSGVTYDPEKRPDIANLLALFGAMVGKTPRAIAEEYNTDKSAFKKALAEAVVARLRPIREEITRLKQDQAHLHSVLKKGEDGAKEVASKNLAEIRRVMGLWAFD